jgi:hypothetical protein
MYSKSSKMIVSSIQAVFTYSFCPIWSKLQIEHRKAKMNFYDFLCYMLQHWQFQQLVGALEVFINHLTISFIATVFPFHLFFHRITLNFEMNGQCIFNFNKFEKNGHNCLYFQFHDTLYSDSEELTAYLRLKFKNTKCKLFEM